MENNSKHSLVKERIVITTKVIILLIAVGKLILVAHDCKGHKTL